MTVTSAHLFADLDFSEDFAIRDQALDQLKELVSAAPTDLRAALQAYVPRADKYQTRVIDVRDRTIRVVAPAGSGKTQTVVNRVIARIREGLRPNRFLVLTFDNAAAEALRNYLR